ncbi:MAG: diguanylate cyclase [Ruminococcaceae bacterium]|nr:diguanylate cyclase [Oscillospiraceae bacterium]
MSLNERLFVIIPLASMLCNLFLFLTFLTAKKTKLVKSFMWLLVAFMMWTTGSLLMRLGVYPGVPFWYDISITGIFLVPLFIYNFIHHFTEQKAFFLKSVWTVLTLICVVLNFFHIFMEHPEINVNNGEKVFSFTIKWPAAFVVILAVAILFTAVRLIKKCVSEGEMSISQFYPLMAGSFIMFLGSVVDAIPFMSSLPNDTFACMINAVLVYYSLYKKRLIPLTQLASSGSTYLVSSTLTTLILVSSYGFIEEMYDRLFGEFTDIKTLVISVLFAFFTIIVYTLMKRLMNNLFVKAQKTLETEVKEFSGAVSRTLNLDEVLGAFCDLVKKNIDTDTAFIFIYDAKKGKYMQMASTDPLKGNSMSVERDSPLCKWLLKNHEAVMYRDYKKTVSFKALWESEKKQLETLGIKLIVPFINENELVGIGLFTKKMRDKPYTQAELIFLESAASIASIAMKNASLYETIKHEAQVDGLTGIYNRKYFIEQFNKDFENCREDAISLVFLNLDDFKLYNELYGNDEGDAALVRFAGILKNTIGQFGTVARFGGKEFAISLPGCGSSQAKAYVEKIREEFIIAQEMSDDVYKKSLTFSAGICSYPSSANNPSQMLTNVNMAVYSAKRDGKNKIVVYTRERSLKTQEKSKKTIGQEYMSTIYALTAAIDAKDHYTFNHSQNVSAYATQLAEAIGLDEEHVEIIRQAGLLHDIGKIGIPEAILSKKERLTDEEFEIMKKHVEGAIAMIRHLPSLDYVIPNAITHHERWDGKGYPRGIAGENIPVGGRCLAIVDSFDAMLSKRPYKEPMSVDDALAEIEKNLGRQFDPDLGKVFIELVKNGTIKVNQNQPTVGF